MSHSWNAEQFQSQLSSHVTVYTPDYWPTWLILIALAIVGMLAALGLHAFLRYKLAPKIRLGHQHKSYLYPISVRAWHWSNAALFVVLLASGLLNHFAVGPYQLMATLVQVHKIAGFLLLISWIGFVLINAYGGNGHHYIVRFKGFVGRAVKQTRFYLFGIMKGEPHPFESNEENKFNPLQQAAYVAIMYLLVPALLLTGFLCLYPSLGLAAGMGFWALKLHFVLALAGLMFMLGHLYLCTTGDTPTTSFHSMIDGYHRHHDIEIISENKPVEAAQRRATGQTVTP
ncbi:thiosulfate reductase cytochrome B [Leminorella grimontii]|uniref:Thiosulfate reductase cytochrome B n=1 Tax=Leminorella grimontii TaxID=82981 RepID=A0AAV5N0H9_9GAMM|nr:thiosulfate reductase cytochrome B subunit [Leminorella grimontii ATCC 33999 = DSM 5078]GKX54443.1 thiosulfate reductase cytochrome B [Leminorella grimontii]GKX57862.1 thiosulfate reductase cytochrome B [Leminorella grimontii]VFS59266.1 thiosulfate reductase cytochrome B subunit [Leminorella grimontii]